MTPGRHPFDAVLAEARANAQHLEAVFNTPVLFVVAEQDDSDDGPTEPHATRVQGSALGLGVAASWVVPIRPRADGGNARKLSFGRSEVCDVVLPFPQVSKHHGFLEQLGPDWYVTDVGSTNGTTVDGKKVGRVSAQLTDGCTIDLGGVKARFMSAAEFVQFLRMRLALAAR